MIHIKYKELFDLEILHNFYSSNRSADFRVIPTAETSSLFGSLGLRYLPTKYGGKVFAKVSTVGGVDIIKTPLPANTKFSFKLILVNSSFSNFTAVNLSKPVGNYYYFNNLLNNISADGFPLLVSDTGTKSVTDSDLLPFISNTFSYTHNQAIAERTGTIEMIDSGDKLVQTLKNNNNNFNFSFDLSPLPQGRAKFSVLNSVKSRFYIIDAAERESLYGIAEIFFSNSSVATYQFLQPNGAITTKHYKISFASRQTKWRYIINKKYNASVSAVTVAKTSAPAISFSIVPGAPAGQFIVTSNNLLPFKEESIQGIKLSDQANKIIVPNLPNPSAASIKPEGADVFSDILITI